jgi:quercetin dioxygenase-like cupin family protein
MTGKSGNGNGATSARAGFEIFRGQDAPLLGDTGAMPLPPIAAESGPDFARAVEAGLGYGERVRLVYSRPGFSITHVWFKKNFPLPLHSHDADCLYYITAGNLRIGDKTLGKGDGFFIPKDMPYTYRAGPDGVELLEYRMPSASTSSSIQTRRLSGRRRRRFARPTRKIGKWRRCREGKR